jgi:hypothetical protein
VKRRGADPKGFGGSQSRRYNNQTETTVVVAHRAATAHDGKQLTVW